VVGQEFFTDEWCGHRGSRGCSHLVSRCDYLVSRHLRVVW